ncbi:VirB4 family type IV secretion system protein [Clostridium estertheticum]|uniref:VirB4 family type IV secretion system protein n=1 Tax=Clostridium estertheticum TaxID=238834 RepID=UPI001C0B78B9|nr:ATP-binding protein [Clostridium estertheticum]MBU3174414.1 ATP-binding protein [Clostridium estertheticum]
MTSKLINIKDRILQLKNKKIKKVNKYNPDFIYDIQPSGGLSFKESYTKKGDGYETCIQIYDFPAHVDAFWLYDLMNINNVITAIDIASTKESEVVSNINKSLREQLDRFYNEKDQIERISAETKYNELTEIFNQISRSGEVVKLVNVRLFVSAKTLTEMEESIRSVLETLEGLSFKGTIFLNETEFEYKSLFTSHTKTKELPNKRMGKEIGSKTLAAGYPFHFTKLDDDNGTYLGGTTTGGNILFDMFYKDKLRRYYNSIIIGTMGSGKSTLLKKLTLDNACRGNLIRGIDVTGEFENEVKELGGKMIALDGTCGIINPLQILRTSDKEGISFMQHLSKLTTFYKFLAPTADDETCKEFELLARELYIKCGIFKEGLDANTLNLTGLKENQYPIFNDLLTLVKEELYEDIPNNIIRKKLSGTKLKRLESIELTLKSMVNNYGYLFNGYSSIENIIEEQVVFFSIKNLRSMKKEIFNAQMFNVLNLLWDNMLQNGKKYKNLFDTNSIAWEDIVRYLIVIDEAHKIINPENLLAVKFLIEFEREARKYFGGLAFVSQSIRDFIPEGTSSEGLNEIKTLFELTQYKFIMQQDNNALKTLRTVFEGNFSESEFKKIPVFSEGECILSINSVGNIAFHVEASEKELNMFQGGA